MRLIILGVFLFLSSVLHANDTAVTEWTKQILINTFTVDYTYETQDLPPPGFTQNAWRGLKEFLGNYLPIIREQRLSVHPRFLIEPKVVDSGEASGIRYWRVNEELIFPELRTKVAFSLLLIATKNNSYLIQSLDMAKEDS